MLVSVFAQLPQPIDPPAPKLWNGKFASGGVLLPEQAAFDVQQYELVLAVDPSEQAIRGTLTVTAKVVTRLGHLVLDLDDALEVTRCTSGERELPFKHKGGMI